MNNKNSSFHNDSAPLETGALKSKFNVSPSDDQQNQDDRQHHNENQEEELHPIIARLIYMIGGMMGQIVFVLILLALLKGCNYLFAAPANNRDMYFTEHIIEPDIRLTPTDNPPNEHLDQISQTFVFMSLGSISTGSDKMHIAAQWAMDAIYQLTGGEDISDYIKYIDEEGLATMAEDYIADPQRLKRHLIIYVAIVNQLEQLRATGDFTAYHSPSEQELEQAKMQLKEIDSNVDYLIEAFKGFLRKYQ